MISNSMGRMSVPEDHKLCGFFCAVLAVDQSQKTDAPPDAAGTPCELFADGSVVGFRCESGGVLTVIPPRCGSEKSRRGGRSDSVVHQVVTLLRSKCLNVVARLASGIQVRGEDGCSGGGGRAVVLVDVYLPVAVWSDGWQFPKSGTTAATFFKHLSCDWKRRNLILENYYSDIGDSEAIWDVPDCHVVECRMHRDVTESARAKLFELHEIFKSLPSVSSSKDGILVYPGVKQADVSRRCCIADLSDDLIVKILNELGPEDLTRISVTCRHLMLLSLDMIPHMKLKLYSHQRAAVEWMLQRERNSDILPHPLYMHFVDEDGLRVYICRVTGRIATDKVPTVKDFRGGMFCDEPGLGKTITALSLILKTRGTLASPPNGAKVICSTYKTKQRCGYYETQSDNCIHGDIPAEKASSDKKRRRGQLSMDEITPTDEVGHSSRKSKSAFPWNGFLSRDNAQSSRSLSGIKRNLFSSSVDDSDPCYETNIKTGSKKRKYPAKRSSLTPIDKESHSLSYQGCSSKKHKMTNKNASVDSETWVQCDSCRKWRKLTSPVASNADEAWFCSMNTNPLYQGCADPEESWDHCEFITDFPGFHTKEASGGKEENVSFFTSILKEHYTCMDSSTKNALKWFAKLSCNQLSEMETVGLVHPVAVSSIDSHGYSEIFQAFGFFRRVVKGITRWYYPQTLDGLVFDLAALRTALCKPLDSRRLYLSKATLIVVPANLVDHWKTQIQKHVRLGQLKVFVWTDLKKPPVHDLAWGYDVVITTFNRLSAEWAHRKTSAMMQVHWLRIMLDEGHTLGSSLNMTNKLQMAISLKASSRWLLTGTPTPNTPNSQLSHLRPLLTFLHEEAFGQDPKSWECGILRPFELKMEEGRMHLVQLLQRCMISARKKDLQIIPPCIKKVTFVNFEEKHAQNYNELVVTIRRNILMADWNDPSHVESLLNPKQWKLRMSTIRNVRLSCCVAGHIKVSDAGIDIQETMDILVEHGLDLQSEEYDFIKTNLLVGGDCFRCKDWCRLPVVTPCRHLLCLNCVALDSEKCALPGCGKSYEMQTPEELARPENPNPKWPIPKDLIELQPSYEQDDWHPDWQSTSSSKVSYLVSRLKSLQEANKTDIHSTDDISKYYQNAEPVQISQLENSNPTKLSDRFRLPQKVIIFSQFLEHIHVIEQQLKIAGISFVGMYSPMHSGNKIKSLATFEHDMSCMALLMDGTAALGLDLSFVTDMFLMEPIWDRSLEEQVISRAHRMGATRPITVETLAMKGTIEEQMLTFLQDADACGRIMKQESGKPGSTGERPKRTLHDFAESNYLAHLSSVQTTSTS